MNRLDGRVVLSPTDLVGALVCEHLTQLELAATRGELVRPQRADPELDLLARRGEAHEASQLALLRAGGAMIVEIGDHEESREGLLAAEAETLAAMRAGADVVYQAAFFDGTWRGRADFLLRVPAPSRLGDWSYEVADAKLARSVRVSALLQMCEYSLHVERLQGTAPERIHVLLGSGVRETHRLADCAAYHRAARRRLEETVLGIPVVTYPDPVEHCDECRWRDRCMARRRADDHLSLVAGMGRDQTRRMVAAGITTVAALAVAPERPRPDMGAAPWSRLRQQARLQMEERSTGTPRHELLDMPLPGIGLASLPPPSAGDLFFDIEGDPFVLDGGLEYLFGVVEIAGDGTLFHPFWAHDRAQEKVAFEGLVDFLIERLDRDPAMHVYHYATYEPVALKKLMGRHATREEEVDRLLRGGVLIDLYQAVRQGVRVSRESYSLKSLEVFYMAKRQEAIADAGSSIVAYEKWLETPDQRILDDIADYNERDCVSTRLLRDWLEELRDELAVRGGTGIARPPEREGMPSEALSLAMSATRDLAASLTAGLAEDREAWTGEERARWLLAQLLDWHRREDKSEWWEFFGRCAMSDEELLDDADAVGGLTHAGALRPMDRGTVHGYSFDPSQEYRLDVGEAPCDPRTGKPAGEVVAIDRDRGWIELKRGRAHEARGQPSSLIPPPPIDTRGKRAALQRLATWVAANAMVGEGPYSASRDLLIGDAPRLHRGSPAGALLGAGEDPVAGTCRLVADLDGSCLAVQGPPGCGKTYTGAQVVVDLVARGRKVGVSAFTHRAIGHLLEEVTRVAAARGQAVRILQKCREGEDPTVAGVRPAVSAQAAASALQAGDADVVAGTSWFFAAEALDGLLDAAVIDEAGQMSLADACVVGSAARNLVLLGDPQQLAQPARGIHPPGAEASALEHVLRGLDTIPPDRGVFLPTTRRMHPLVCGFVSAAFYDRRLLAVPACSEHRLEAKDGLPLMGLRHVPTPHAGNRTWSPEEVAEVSRLVSSLVGASWSDAGGTPRPLTLDDVLVVAPYNAQVQRLREALPGGARAGTVDKFQGQQAPVTVYSMATSSMEDLPRNLEFLYSRNRLNVAVSRAQALAVVVCAPALLCARCRTPEQLRLVNSLCSYVEWAESTGPAAPGLL